MCSANLRLLMVLGRSSRIFLPFVVSVLILGACSNDGADSSSLADPVPLETSAVDRTDVPIAYLSKALADVSGRTGLDEEALTIVDASAVLWASQRLGCVQFDQPSNPSPVDGYRIVIDAGDFQFDYRLDGSGELNLCGVPIEISPDGGEPDHSEQADDPTS